MTVSLPFVTVIMPIRNEGRFIERSLGAVLAQDYPPDRLEVIVADGMSDDETRQILASSKFQLPNVKVIDNPGRIVPIAMNRGIAEAKGEIIVRVDGHTIIEPMYVTECVKALERSGAENVGGRMDAVATGRVAQSIALATSSPFGVGGARFHYSDKEELVDTVYMGAWRRDVLERLRGFDEEMVRNQDDELNYRLRAAGGRILLSPAIRSKYYSRSTFKKLWSQYFQYGYWKVRVLQKHPGQMQPRQFVPGAFAASIFAGLCILPFSPVPLLAVTGVYGVANLAASLVTALRGRLVLFPFLPVAFAILHLSYGSGFILGLFRFRNAWTARLSQRGALGLERRPAHLHTND